MAIYDNNMMKACSKSEAACDMPVPAGDIISAVVSNSYTIDHLGSALDALRGRIEPIVGAEIPKDPAKDQAERSPSCSLHASLLEQGARLRSLEAFVDSLTSRIQL
jgi:hypothetical protein